MYPTAEQHYASARQHPYGFGGDTLEDLVAAGAHFAGVSVPANRGLS
jgi:hypothetical protein